jgi:choline dehydrogenase-like flavoprotein
MIIQGKDISKPVRESADVIVIGSGCGGGPVARTLAASGKRVILLEEGGYFTTAEFDGKEETAYRKFYQRQGGQATDDLSITVLQGRCVGGSSMVNWMTSLRTPEFVLDNWWREFRIEGMGPKDLEPYFERVERFLNVHEEPEENDSPNNRLLLDGARALGYRVRRNGRNARDCIKSGACGLGCPYGAKLSVDVTYIPAALKAGAQVFADCRAEKIEVAGSLKRVSGNVLNRETRSPKTDFVFEAPVVVVSASAIGSPVLLLKSRLANSSGELGRNLTLHLTTAVASSFGQAIEAGAGIPQSVLCDEFLNKNGDGGGFWLEAVPVYPALAALSLPGFGEAHWRMIRNYPHLGVTIALVKEIDSSGRVSVNSHGRPSISYELGPRDGEYLRQSVGEAARIHFASGAPSVMTLHATPTVIPSPEKIEAVLNSSRWGMNDLCLFSAHPLGTCRMARDRAQGVVDSHCQSHDVKGLFVIDGSVVPTSLGVNPQVTLLAIAEKSAEWIAENSPRMR